jgi:predicted hotdog family 3-hydroxylacyl-ACP dehydratase
MSKRRKITRLDQCTGMPAAEFVMHRDEMLLLDSVWKAEEEITICEWRVSEDHAFIDSRRGVPAFVGVEFMAQCVAVHAGVRARVDGLGPPLGLLLGTRHFRSTVEYFEIGENYRACCKELIRDDYGMGSYDCTITHRGKEIAEARLAVLEKERGCKLDD